MELSSLVQGIKLNQILLQNQEGHKCGDEQLLECFLSGWTLRWVTCISRLVYDCQKFPSFVHKVPFQFQMVLVKVSILEVS